MASHCFCARFLTLITLPGLFCQRQFGRWFGCERSLAGNAALAAGRAGRGELPVIRDQCHGPSLSARTSKTCLAVAGHAGGASLRQPWKDARAKWPSFGMSSLELWWRPQCLACHVDSFDQLQHTDLTPGRPGASSTRSTFSTSRGYPCSVVSPCCP